MSEEPEEPRKTPEDFYDVVPVLIAPDYTSHDAHGYKHGLGPCICESCKELRE